MVVYNGNLFRRYSITHQNIMFTQSKDRAPYCPTWTHKDSHHAGAAILHADPTAGHRPAGTEATGKHVCGLHHPEDRHWPHGGQATSGRASLLRRLEGRCHRRSKVDNSRQGGHERRPLDSAHAGLAHREGYPAFGPSPQQLRRRPVQHQQTEGTDEEGAAFRAGRLLGHHRRPAANSEVPRQVLRQLLQPRRRRCLRNGRTLRERETPVPRNHKEEHRQHRRSAA